MLGVLVMLLCFVTICLVIRGRKRDKEKEKEGPEKKAKPVKNKTVPGKKAGDKTKIAKSQVNAKTVEKPKVTKTVKKSDIITVKSKTDDSENNKPSGLKVAKNSDPDTKTGKDNKTNPPKAKNIDPPKLKVKNQTSSEVTNPPKSTSTYQLTAKKKNVGVAKTAPNLKKQEEKSKSTSENKPKKKLTLKDKLKKAKNGAK